MRRTPTIDYDLHGVVGIRLLDATSSDARAVERQLGPFRRVLAREPDIVIRFVERLLPGAKLRLLGVNDAAFTDEDFLLLRSRYYSEARVRIPFSDIGGRCEIVCESGLPAVPLLIAIINLTALARGVAPLHASAFTVDGRGVLVTGWSKGGKTEAVLGFAARGAQFLGDEWIYLDPGADQMYGLPQPIRLWSWHLTQFPQFRARVAVRHRMRMGAIAASLKAGGALCNLLPARSTARRSYERLREVMGRQIHVDVEPEVLFGPLDTLEARIDRVFLVASHDSPDIVVEPLDAQILAHRMLYSVHYEFANFMSYYDMFRFAFPGAANPLIDTVEDRLGHLLARALEGKLALAVHHPYPFRIATLVDAMRPHI